MRQPVKLIIRKTKCSKDGNHTIFLQYCYTAAKRVVISTGVSIPAMFWDKTVNRILPSLPAANGSAATLQDIVEKQRTKAERIITYATEKNLGCPMQFLKRIFRLPDCWDLDQLEKDNNNLSVFYQIERYIDDKNMMVQPATITVIKTMKKHLLAFQNYIGYKVTFESFNAVLYNNWCNI